MKYTEEEVERLKIALEHHLACDQAARAQLETVRKERDEALAEGRKFMSGIDASLSGMVREIIVYARNRELEVGAARRETANIMEERIQEVLKERGEALEQRDEARKARDAWGNRAEAAEAEVDLARKERDAKAALLKNAIEACKNWETHAKNAEAEVAKVRKDWSDTSAAAIQAARERDEWKAKAESWARSEGALVERGIRTAAKQLGDLQNLKARADTLEKERDEARERIGDMADGYAVMDGSWEKIVNERNAANDRADALEKALAAAERKGLERAKSLLTEADETIEGLLRGPTLTLKIADLRRRLRDAARGFAEQPAPEVVVGGQRHIVTGAKGSPRSSSMIKLHDEVKRGRAKFPGNRFLLAGLVEEVGELARAILQKKDAEIEAEAIQVAGVALRIAEERDGSFNDLTDEESQP
jgi:hypothetical protein